MIFLYLKLIKAAAAACSGLFLVSEPAPDSYNLMNLYPEEISTEAAAANAAERLIKPLSDLLGCQPEQSVLYQPYGSIFYDKLCRRDAAWSSDIYRWLQSTPEDAGLTGISAWDKINFRIVNGDGTPISLYSNAKEILSMVSVYTWYDNWEDTETFEDYMDALWQASHELHTSISPVTWCEGCIGPDTEAQSLETEDSGTEDADFLTTETEITASDANAMISSCPGHAELTVTVTIHGMAEKNSLFLLDSFGTVTDEFWAGWTPETKELAARLCSQDWEKQYKLTAFRPGFGTPLSSREINTYLSELPAGLSKERREVIDFALRSVGKIPYYYGGKAYHPGYENNHFGSPAEPDTKGRMLSGLDCSGWINWIYYSVIGMPLSQHGTGSLIPVGADITPAALQPGDLLLRISSDSDADSHAAIFLGWNPDGTMKIIHETGEPVNNVTVTTSSSPWTYYKAVLE